MDDQQEIFLVHLLFPPSFSSRRQSLKEERPGIFFSGEGRNWFPVHREWGRDPTVKRDMCQGWLELEPQEGQRSHGKWPGPNKRHWGFTNLNSGSFQGIPAEGPSQRQFNIQFAHTHTHTHTQRKHHHVPVQIPRQHTKYDQKHSRNVSLFP